MPSMYYLSLEIDHHHTQFVPHHHHSRFCDDDRDVYVYILWKKTKYKKQNKTGDGMWVTWEQGWKWTSGHIVGRTELKERLRGENKMCGVEGSALAIIGVFFNNQSGLIEGAFNRPAVAAFSCCCPGRLARDSCSPSVRARWLAPTAVRWHGSSVFSRCKFYFVLICL